MSTKVYGASDDLIEFEGDLYDEYNGGDADLLFVIDGVVYQARIELEDNWHIKVNPGEFLGLDVVIWPAGSPTAVDLCGRDYSDVLVINEHVDYAVAGLVANRK